MGLLGEVDGKGRPHRRVAARLGKPLGWRRFSGPRTGDQLAGRPWSRPTPKRAGRVEKSWTGGGADEPALALGQPCSAHTLPVAFGPDSAWLLDGRRDRPTRWRGRRRRASPHIYRKKKEKKNRRRNGTGSAGMLINLGKNAEVPRKNAEVGGRRPGRRNGCRGATRVIEGSPLARSIHPRLPQHPPPPTTAHLRPRIHARPVRRKTPIGGPLTDSRTSRLQALSPCTPRMELAFPPIADARDEAQTRRYDGVCADDRLSPIRSIQVVD